YDRVQLGGKGARGKPEGTPPWQDVSAGGQEALSQTQAVQRALTIARKADAKIRRLRSEVDVRKQQWEKFIVEQKQNFVRQKRQFGDDISKLEHEIQQATAAGHEAAERMKAIVLQGVEAVRQQEVAMETEDDEWDRLMQEEEASTVPSGFLQEAYSAAQRLQSGPPATAVVATDAGGGRGLPMTGGSGMPPYNHASPLGASTDPYLASPTFGPGGPINVALHRTGPNEAVAMSGATPRPPSTPVVTPQRGTTAMPMTPPPARPPGLPADGGTISAALGAAPDPNVGALPNAATESAGTGLADKLAAKREERCSALHPFKVCPSDSGMTSRPTPEDPGPPQAARPHLIEDDGDDSLRMASPGLTHME
ncbi:unnamed protein product, partial [Symbiodinium sp. CCMP2456]